MNIWSQIIDALTRDPDLQRRCIRALRKTCGIYGILPASYAFAPPLTRSGTLAIGTGGFADVWKYTDPENKAYAVKALRVYEKDPVTKINKVRSSRQTQSNLGVEVPPLGAEILQGSNYSEANDA